MPRLKSPPFGIMVITPSSEFQLYTLGEMLNASSRLVKLKLPIVGGLTFRGFLAAAFYLLLGTVFALAQQESPLDAKINRQRGLEMLADIQRTLTEQYYDPSFHGIDLNERFRIAKERIKDLQTNPQIFRVI